MPIANTDLQFYAAANMPTDDVSTAGGAIDPVTQVAFDQFSAAARPEIVSDGADTRDITITGRAADGSPLSETLALDGTNPVLFAGTFERIHTVEADAGSASRTVTVAQGTGGTVRAILLPDIEALRMLFINATSDPSDPKVYYEKVFGFNAHATLALLAARIVLTDDPSTDIRIGVGTVDGTATITDRLTEPGGVTWKDDDEDADVPGGVLAAGEAIEVWVELRLAAAAAPAKSTATLALRGSTT